MIAAILLILASVCKATADVLLFRYHSSVFKTLDPEFWYPYAAADKVKKIFGYKVDAWHLANSGMIVFFIAAVALHPFDRWQLPWWLEIPAAGLLYNLTFNLFYKIYSR